jgi:uncharacterized Tic20 family protein
MSETGPVPPTGSTPPPASAPPGTPLDYGKASKVPVYAGPEPDNDARMWGMLAHLSCLAGFIIPFGHVLGPLIIWLIKKNEIPFVNDQGKEALNFQITVAIAALISSPLICTGIGIIVPALIVLAGLIFGIIGGVKANSGIAYRYPWALRLIK